jgi:hypothetical protein
LAGGCDQPIATAFGHFKLRQARKVRKPNSQDLDLLNCRFVFVVVGAHASFNRVKAVTGKPHRRGLTISIPVKSFSLSVTMMQ